MRTTSFSNLRDSDLVVDSIYQSNGASLAGEPLGPLLGVGNMGGIRGKRRKKGSKGLFLVAITSSGGEPEWPDSLDSYSGLYTYFGDNRHPGRDLHDTPQGGNRILKEAFELAESADSSQRHLCPLFFIFEKAGSNRDQIFRGLAVPGITGSSEGDALVAIWRTAKNSRFQNYRATFTILDEQTISRKWLQESAIEGFPLLEHPDAPKNYVRWVKTGKRNALESIRFANRSVVEQTNLDFLQQSLLDAIREYCAENPFKFERVAAEVWRLACPAPVSYELTRRHRDGGRDAIGRFFVGPRSDSIGIEFALEAKLYSAGNNAGVKELSRLISRIKHREFGVFVTTSAVGQQAYDEIRTDGHPIVVMAAVDIAEALISAGVSSAKACRTWLQSLGNEE